MKNFISKYGRTEEVKYIPNQKESPVVIFSAIEKLEEERKDLKEHRQYLLGLYIDYLSEKSDVNDRVQLTIDALNENKKNIEQQKFGISKFLQKATIKIFKKCQPGKLDICGSFI